MACTKCGTSVKPGQSGLSLGFLTPLCKACHERLLEDVSALIVKYDELEKTQKSEPKAAAWKALANLLCAERVNVELETYVGIDPIPLKEETWRVSRDKSIQYAEVALRQVPKDSRQAHFLTTVVSRAKRIEAGYGQQLTKVRRINPVGIFGGGGTLYATDIEALLSGLVYSDDFQKTLISIPGHEWLLPNYSETDLQKLPPLKTDTQQGPAAQSVDSDKITLVCSACSKRLRVSKQYAGKQGRCSGCGAKLTIPDVTPAPGVKEANEHRWPEPNKAVLAMVPADVAKTMLVFPLAHAKGVLTLLVAAAGADTKQKCEFVFNSRVELQTAPSQEITALIARYYENS